MSGNGKTTSIPGQLKKPPGIKQNRRSSIGETDGDSTVSVVKGWRISRQWNTVFGDNRLTAALIDRLIHHSHIVIFSGESYRLTQSMRRQRTARG